MANTTLLSEEINSTRQKLWNLKNKLAAIKKARIEDTSGQNTTEKSTAKHDAAAKAPNIATQNTMFLSIERHDANEVKTPEVLLEEVKKINDINSEIKQSVNDLIKKSKFATGRIEQLKQVVEGKKTAESVLGNATIRRVMRDAKKRA